jgi:superfamily II DNA or RNA helicase
MVSEGVDIPRLRVGVYATVAKTPMIFRQIVGRFVRVIPGRPTEHSWVFLPADRGLRALAADIETELRHSVRPDEDEREDEGLLDDDLLERANRVETEPTGVDFVPLRAEVAPQMELFAIPGDPPPAAAAPPPPPPMPMPMPMPEPVTVPEGGADDEPPLSAFERRAQLRKERHELVANLRRLDGRSHAEINGQVNRTLRIRSVDKATIAELEKSIELLRKELEKTSRRRRSRRAAAAR